MDHMPSLTSHARGSAVALIPLRTGGKSRLGTSLTPVARDGLVLAMLDDVLAAVRGAGIDDVRVLAGSSAAALAATDRGLHAILDPTEGAAPVAVTPPEPTAHGVADSDRRLRAAVDAGLAAAPAGAVRLVLAADLPRLTASEIAAVLADPADVVIAPTAGGGTALLRLGPHVACTTRYGPGSAGAHIAVAEQLGRSVTIVDLPGARYDVDAAVDLADLARTLDGAAPGPATAAFLTGARG
jgi:2-phospho-L-lactate guanylyltransferase